MWWNDIKRGEFLRCFLSFFLLSAHTFSVFPGAFSHNFPEDPAEAFGIGKAGLLGDLFDGIISLTQQGTGDLDPVAIEGVVEGVAGDVFKDLAEIAFAVSAGGADRFDIQGHKIAVINGLQSLVDLFDIVKLPAFWRGGFLPLLQLQKQLADLKEIGLDGQIPVIGGGAVGIQGLLRQRGKF